jgi:hypothetical protein
MSQGQIIAAVSAVALVLSLFLAWGGAGGDVPDIAVPEGTPSGPGLEGIQDAAEDAASATGWESQNTLDIYLAITAGLVLIGAAMMLMGNPEGFPFAPAAATFLLGLIGTIMTVYVLIDIPEGAERKIGIYLATAAVIGVTVGSYLQMRDEVAEGY